MLTPDRSEWSLDGRDIRDSEYSEDLKVEQVDLNFAANAENHHTTKYEDEDVKRFVIRRGQDFNIAIKFNRAFDEKNDDIRFCFKFVTRSKEKKIKIMLSEEDYDRQWGARIISNTARTIKVQIMTPPTLFVGIWKLSIGIVQKLDAKNVVFRYDHSEPILMLFNPWCRDDDVYMHDDSLLKEYVLNDTGLLYQSGRRGVSAKPWSFAQFEPPVLECAMWLLDEKSNLNLPARSDPVHITRRLTALTNKVLAGKWNEPYEEGTTQPSSWSGSLEIIRQYHDTKSPVKYGQCWVFSGILTSLCRTLGIPVRSVTNYSSAHDTNNSSTIDMYFDKHFNLIEYDKDNEDSTKDSTWNFHVWNEVWMSRPDLQRGFGGWQAVDATPQELSQDSLAMGKEEFCCGPMPVSAIRRGDVKVPYDGGFIFSEVNADVFYWIENEDGSFMPILASTNRVGKLIVTKRPNSYDFEDLTHEYKFREGTPLERASVMKANACGSLADMNLYNVVRQEDVEFDFEVSKENYGYPIEITVTIRNNSKDQRTLDGIISSRTVYYTGVAYSKIKNQTFPEVVLGPKKSTTVSLKIDFEEYYKKLVFHCLFHHYCMFKVKETKQIFSDQCTLPLGKPKIELKVPRSVKVERKFTIEMSFRNPLPVDLTRCVLGVEGAGLGRRKEIPLNVVKAQTELRVNTEIIPKKKGLKEVIVDFRSDQLVGLSDSRQILVEDI